MTHKEGRSEFKIAKNVAIERIQKEQRRVENGINPWGIYRSHIEEYKKIFGMLPDSDPEKIVEEKTEKGRKVYAADIMSEGQALRDLKQISGGVAVTLGDWRTDEEKEYDAQHNIEVVAGNMLLPSKWNEISKFKKKNHISGFDLLLCRAGSGWGETRITPKLRRLMLERMYHLLSPNGGVLLVELQLNAKKLKDDLDTLGIEAYDDSGLCIKIVRNDIIQVQFPALEQYEW